MPFFQEKISLQALNTFGIAAKAKYYVCVNSVEELMHTLEEYQRLYANEPLLVLGGGSNVLFTNDFQGVVLHINILGEEILTSSTKGKKLVKGYAGENWDNFVNFSLQNQLYGLENLSLIPGTVGAAPVQNIGAYGVEIKDLLYSVETIEINTGKVKTFYNSDCEFGYRDSFFKKNKGKFIITSVVFELSENFTTNTIYKALNDALLKDGLNTPTPQDIRNKVIEIRNSKLPDYQILGNAGSFFKNPIADNTLVENLKQKYIDIPVYKNSETTSKLSAGWLIEKCGWKGKRSGNVGVHDQQALVLINYGYATGNEVLLFAKALQKDIFDKFGITLEIEVNIY